MKLWEAEVSKDGLVPYTIDGVENAYVLNRPSAPGIKGWLIAFKESAFPERSYAPFGDLDDPRDREIAENILRRSYELL